MTTDVVHTGLGNLHDRVAQVAQPSCSWLCSERTRSVWEVCESRSSGLRHSTTIVMDMRGPAAEMSRISMLLSLPSSHRVLAGPESSVTS